MQQYLNVQFGLCSKNETTAALALEICDKENVSDVQVKWEYLKFEIRKFCYSVI